MLGQRRLGERQQLRFVEARLGALRLRIEFANGLNFVAEHFNAHGPIGIGRIDVENSATPCELARHLDDIHLRVADAGEMRGQHFNVDLFAALEGDGEAGVVIQVEKLHGCGFDGGDENVDGAGGEFPQRRCALLLHVRVRRKIFEGKHVVSGKTDHARGIDGSRELASGFEERLEGLGGLVVGNDHDDRLLGGARHQRKIQCPRCCG